MRVLLLALALSLPASAALACRCEHPPVAAAAAKVDAVFVGTVAEVRDAGEGKYQALIVDVERVYRGEVDVRTEVLTPSHSCGLVTGGAKPGRRFVFMVERKGKRLYAQQCNGSRPPSPEASADLARALGEGRPPRP